MLEALVVTICTIGKTGCSESTSAYYKQSDDLQELTRSVNDYGQKITKDQQWLVYTATPIYMIKNKQVASIRVYKNAVLNLDSKESNLIFKWNF